MLRLFILFGLIAAIFVQGEDSDIEYDEYDDETSTQSGGRSTDSVYDEFRPRGTIFCSS